MASGASMVRMNDFNLETYLHSKASSEDQD